MLRRTDLTRISYFASFVALSLSTVACHQGSSRGTVLNQNSQLPAGLSGGGGGLNTGLSGTNLPNLTGNGVPTSLQQSQTTGVPPATLPNNTAAYDFNALLAQWQARWARNPVPYDPAVLPEAIQRYVIQLHCYYGAFYGGFTTSNRYALILSLYLDTLGRYPEWDAVRYHVQTYPNTPDANVRLAQASAFLFSDEATTNTLKRVYPAFLRRNGSDSEIAAWKASIAGGRGNTLESLYSIFVASEEFYKATYGGNSNLRTWIQAAYRDLLGRAANPWEVEYFVHAFSTNGGNREALTLHLANSDEALMKFIVNAHLFYLNRYPTSSELPQRLAEMRQGAHMKVMMSRILATPEYLNRQPRRYGEMLDQKYCQ